MQAEASSFLRGGGVCLNLFRQAFAVLLAKIGLGLALGLDGSRGALFVLALDIIDPGIGGSLRWLCLRLCLGLGLRLCLGDMLRRAWLRRGLCFLGRRRESLRDIAVVGCGFRLRLLLCGLRLLFLLDGWRRLL